MTLNDVLDLLRRAPRPPEEGEPTGATPEQLARLRALVDLPAELVEWLQHVNGTYAGPGGIYGTGTARKALNIEHLYDLYPAWRSKGWVPIAGDGTGNTYVARGGAVYFVDSMESVDEPAYAVASSVLGFLGFLLEKELGASGWPFDSGYVLARDPGMRELSPAPWD